MQKSLRSLLAIVALAASLSATSVYAGPYSAMYVFGDSLSDIGNDKRITGGFVPTPAYYYEGRFSNGLNYADQLANLLGVPLSISLTGGTNYAYGGVRSDYVIPALMPFSAKSFNEQILAYTTSNAHADPEALYTLWIGANDMSDVLSGVHPAGNAMSAVGGVVDDVVDAIQELSLRGARSFLIPNLPDLGLVPEVLDFEEAHPGAGFNVLATSLTQLFNDTLALQLANPLNGLSALNLTLYQFDTFSIHQDMINNPGAYGFTNTRNACYTGYVDGSPLPVGSVIPPSVCGSESYFYWDFEHPSALAHQNLAYAMYEQVPEPGVWIMLMTGFGFLGLQLRRRKIG